MEFNKFMSKTIKKYLNESQVEVIKNMVISNFNNKIEGRLLNKKQAEELQKEIESNYINGDLNQHFNREKDDIRMKIFNYDHPIAEKDLNGVNLRIAEGLIRNKQKTYLLYLDGEIIGEFYSVNDIKNIIKQIEDNLMKNISNNDENDLNETYLSDDNKLKDMSQDDINEILNGYIKCSLWTEEENLKHESDKSFATFTLEDIDNDSKIEAYLEIKKFIKDAGDAAIEEAIEENGLYQLGMDIWFTRNNHGSGFFNYNYENEDILIKAGKKLGSKHLYVGDDDKLYYT
jgi:hypothetical protein